MRGGKKKKKRISKLTYQEMNEYILYIHIELSYIYY